jgi:hypothetical protein
MASIVKLRRQGKESAVHDGSLKSELIRDTAIRPVGEASDTLRLWEGYQEQATLWRAIALLQVPVTVAALVVAILLWTTRSITLTVPVKPLPGTYLAREIPDTEFVDFATRYINLVATYQPAVAPRQYAEARRFLWNPYLEIFDRDFIEAELKAINTTNRTQIFFIDPTKTTITRGGSDDRAIEVGFTGDRYKMIAGKDAPTKTTLYTITMTTVPRNDVSPYGIVITNVVFKDIEVKSGEYDKL